MITGEDIMAMTLEYGFEHAAFLNCDTIVPLEEVRRMCAADACGKYGRNWSCPPACGSLAECRERIRFCKSGILVQTVGELEDSMDVESMLETERRHRRRFEKMQEALAEKLPRLLALGSGCCTRCEKCTYPEQPCRFPRKLISSMEAYGLLVSDLCKKMDWPITTGRTGSHIHPAFSGIMRYDKEGGLQMERRYPNLCRPITIGRVTFRNRMFSAPMGGTDITNDGCIGPKSTAFYELRAKGGAGGDFHKKVYGQSVDRARAGGR